MIDGFLDFYNKQKSPIFDGKGNVTGYNHGYGNVENFDKPIPRDQYTGPGPSMGENNSPDISLGDFERGAFGSDEAYRKAYGLDEPRSLRNDQISEADARNLSPGLGNILDQIESNRSSSGNKIDTSNQNNKMANGSGAEMLSNYLGNARNITPQYRKRDMVDLELSRGGRTSAFIPVGQHRDSENLGYTNDFANAPGGFLNWYSGGQVSPSGAGNMGQQTDSGNIGGQQASGQGAASGAGNYGGPNINISNVNNPQAVANTGTIQDSTISNPATGTASQTTSDNTNTNTNTNTPVVTPIGGGPTPIGGGPTPIGGGPTPIGGGPTPIGGGPTPIGGGPTPIGGGPTPIGGGPTPLTNDVERFIANTGATSATTLANHPDHVDPYGRSSVEKALDHANTLFTGGTITDDSGNTYDEMLTGGDFEGAVLANSPEERDFVQKSYWDIFGRAPEKKGYDYWTNALNSGSMNPDAFIASLQGSPEALSRHETGQGGAGLIYQDVDDYLAGGGQGGNPSASGGSGTTPVADWDTTSYVPPVATPPPVTTFTETSTPPPVASPTSYGGGTQSQNYITNQTAYDAEQADRAQDITHSTTANVDSATQSAANTNLGSTSNTVDDWLTDFYTEHGINQGKVDQGGRDYWTSALANKSKAEVEKDILWAAANA